MSEQIKRLLRTIIGISLDDINEIIEFLDHDEWGVAYEILCTVIEQENTIITIYQYQEIEDIGNKMNMDSNLWNEIKYKV